MLDLKMSDHVMLHGKPVWGWWRIVPESPTSVPQLEEDYHPDTGWTRSRYGTVASDR